MSVRIESSFHMVSIFESKVELKVSQIHAYMYLINVAAYVVESTALRKT